MKIGRPILLWINSLLVLLWSFFILLDYLHNRDYISSSFINFQYLDLLFLCLLFFGVFIWLNINRPKSKWKSIKFKSINGTKILLLFIGLLIIIFLVYSKHVDLLSKNGVIKFSYFIGFSLLHILSLIIIVVIGYAIGSAFINKTNVNPFIKKILSIGIGWIGITLFIFLIAAFGYYNFYTIAGFFVCITILRFKAILEFIVHILFKRICIQGISIVTLIPIFLILIFVAHHFISMLKPFPTGFDASNYYINLSKLLVDYQGLVKGEHAYNWSVFMSLGLTLFKSMPLTLLLSILPGIINLFLIFYITKKLSSIVIAVFTTFFFYSMPLILFHSAVDAKVDQALLFYSLLVVAIIVDHYKEMKNTSRIFNPLFIIIGVLLGYSFGIKYTSVFTIFSIVSIFLYLRFGKYSFVGISLVFISFLYLLKLYSFTWVSFDEGSMFTTSLIILVLGLIILLYSIYPSRKVLKITVLQLSVMFLALFLTFAPWGIKHIVENDSISITSILYGKINTYPIKDNLDGNTISYQNHEKIDVDDIDHQKPETLSENKPKVKRPVNTAKYEEISRYSGYEKGLIRFLSLLYDNTMGKNVGLMHIDIAWFLLLFLPLLGFGYNDKFLLGDLIRSIIMITVLVFSVYSLYAAGNVIPENTFGDMKSRILAQNAYDYGILDGIYISMLTSILFAGSLLKDVYSLFIIDNYVLNFSIILVIYFALFFWYKKTIKLFSFEHKILVILSVSYFFYWFLIGGGIIWYALPMVALATILIFSSYELIFVKTKILKFNFIANCLIWIILSVPLVYSNSDNNNKQLGDDFIFEYFADYVTGEKGYFEVLDEITPAYSVAVKEINKNEAGVFIVGSYIKFHIKYNDKRVKLDSQLSIFDRFYSNCETLDQVVDLFKTNKFKYLVVDLNTPSLDKTPEKSLVKKFNNLMYFVTNNKSLRLISTDRIIQSDENKYVRIVGQKIKGKFSMGEGNVIYPGRVAIYEIL